jgi:hypothetical protein
MSDNRKLYILQKGMPSHSGVSKISEFIKKNNEGKEMKYNDRILKVYDEDGEVVGKVLDIKNVSVSSGNIMIEIELFN